MVLNLLIYVFLCMCMPLCGLLCVYLSVCIYVCVVVVTKKANANPVTLACGTKTDGAFTWKFDDELLEHVGFEDKLQHDGQNLIVPKVYLPMLGEYSCWRGGERLSSTYLLLEADGGETSGEILLFHFSFILLVI